MVLDAGMVPAGAKDEEVWYDRKGVAPLQNKVSVLVLLVILHLTLVVVVAYILHVSLP